VQNRTANDRLDIILHVFLRDASFRAGAGNLAEINAEFACELADRWRCMGLAVETAVLRCGRLRLQLVLVRTGAGAGADTEPVLEQTSCYWCRLRQLELVPLGSLQQPVLLPCSLRIQPERLQLQQPFLPQPRFDRQQSMSLRQPCRRA
jgi:hypothetical protein